MIKIEKTFQYTTDVEKNLAIYKNIIKKVKFLGVTLWSYKELLNQEAKSIGSDNKIGFKKE